MLAVAIWGISASQSISRSYGNMPVVAFLTYFVLFAPFALIGSLVLWAGWNKATSNWPRRAFRQLLDAVGSLFAAEPHHSLEPLDERTRKRLDAAGTNSAKVLGVLSGAVLIGLGIVGLVAEAVEIYGSGFHSGRYYFPATRLTVTFVIGCGLAIVAGARILRGTFRKADRSWLVPLKIFTTVVSARVASDQARREQGKPLSGRSASGERQKTLTAHQPTKKCAVGPYTRERVSKMSVARERVNQQGLKPRVLFGAFTALFRFAQPCLKAWPGSCPDTNPSTSSGQALF